MGSSFQTGDFYEPDSCNRCYCQSSGEFSCTEIDCGSLIDEGGVDVPDDGSGGSSGSSSEGSVGSSSGGSTGSFSE